MGRIEPRCAAHLVRDTFALVEAQIMRPAKGNGLTAGNSQPAKTRIILCDPHRAIVVGGNRLHGDRISSPDIRAGMALLIAALCAKGESVIQNIHQIDRGYERIDERLNALGAVIRREEDR